MPNHEKRLSPGQTKAKGFPVVGEREPAPFPVADWRLTVDGLVQHPLHLSREDLLQQFPAAERTWDTICVTGWTHWDHRWRGVLLATLLDRAEPLPAARFVRFVAYSTRQHDTSLPLAYAREHVLLAHEVDGKPLEPAHGAPLRSVCEGKYFYKSLKWLRQIELLAEDRLGYWERESAYHNDADPWLEQRYDPQPMGQDEFARRRAARDFSYAKAIQDAQFQQLRRSDLSQSHWEGAQIKGCVLSHVRLQGASCHGANFTLTKFINAGLGGADLRHCDLEGADFCGADLRGADLRGTSLTVARFFNHQHQRPAHITGAQFLRRDIENEGLGEAERQFVLDPQNHAIISNEAWVCDVCLR
jgi:DMSO/TMAO reductase YedYZ molybdopterin-dependent catalytic subunit